MTKKGHQQFREIDNNSGELLNIFVGKRLRKGRSLKNFGKNLAPPFLKFWIR